MNDNVLLIGASGFMNPTTWNCNCLTLISRTGQTAEPLLSRNHTDWRCSRSTGTRPCVSRFWHCCTGSRTPRWRQPYFSLLWCQRSGYPCNVLAAKWKNGVKNILPVPLLFMVWINTTWRKPSTWPSTTTAKVSGRQRKCCVNGITAPTERSLTIIRPIVLRWTHRGNVYNLLKQIAGGKFMMVGAGLTISPWLMLKHCWVYQVQTEECCQVARFITTLISQTWTWTSWLLKLNKAWTKRSFYALALNVLGMLGGYCFDILSKITGKNTLSALCAWKILRNNSLTQRKCILQVLWHRIRCHKVWIELCSMNSSMPKRRHNVCFWIMQASQRKGRVGLRLFGRGTD